MRDIFGITTALIFQPPAEYKNEAECRLKNRRLLHFTLFDTQKIFCARAFLSSLDELQ